MTELVPSLADHAAGFAREIQASVDGVLPGRRRIVSRKAPDGERYIVRPDGDSVSERRLPVFVDGDHLADLGVSLYLDLDRSGRFLKTVRSDLVLHSVLDRTPLVRLDYRSDMRSAPSAHWQIHAERGSFTHLLAHSHRHGRVNRPHDLSSLHFPVGGERFRPCLEDVLQFLVQECGVDHHDTWEAAVSAGRARWRQRQLRSTVRDLPAEAADALRDLGWTVDAPSDSGNQMEKSSTLTQW